MKKILFLTIFFIGLLQSNALFASKTILPKTFKEKPHYAYFLDFFSSTDILVHQKAIDHISENWIESDEILLVDTLYFIKDHRIRRQLLKILEEKTTLKNRDSYNTWYATIWNKPATYNNDYFTFKAKLHSFIDHKFPKYFYQRAHQSLIRLDEVRWGGVRQDGIPPLRNPKMIAANDAKYLDDSNIIFGIEINGDFRAYPKRILAWHELFTDTVGNIPVAGVYCTLCGTVILYKTKHNGVHYNLGTSGFLYRSNKLMYDQKTQSLWSTTLGKPVIGPLANKNIQLEYLSVVTSTWGTWKKAHPNTKVLSINTGHKRNYDEGIAYKSYFATDKLMFNIPKLDYRLNNKDEVLVIKNPSVSDEIIAIASNFLKQNSIYYDKINQTPFVIFTDKSGAHRAYFNEALVFKKYYPHKHEVIDQKGITWEVHENYLRNKITNTKINRLHSYSAFWFGLQSQYPNLRLVK